MLEKSSICVETRPSALSLFEKFDFGNSNQKSRKNGYQTFLFLYNITGFLYFVPNILSRIVGILMQNLIAIDYYFFFLFFRKVTSIKKKAQKYLLRNVFRSKWMSLVRHCFSNYALCVSQRYLHNLKGVQKILISELHGLLH